MGANATCPLARHCLEFLTWIRRALCQTSAPLSILQEGPLFCCFHRPRGPIHCQAWLTCLAPGKKNKGSAVAPCLFILHWEPLLEAVEKRLTFSVSFSMRFVNQCLCWKILIAMVSCHGTDLH